MPRGGNANDSVIEGGVTRGSEINEGDGFSVVKRGRGGGNKGSSGNVINGNQEIRDSSGLLANRQRGFSSSSRANVRVPTTNLQDMQAKDGALVSKFMTFLCRKNTFVVDLYEAAFFRSKPTFD